MINCSKALHLVPLVLLAGCLGAQALFSAVLVVWISFFSENKSFFPCILGESDYFSDVRWSWPFLDFLFFLWKELITATKRVKKGERWGGRKGEKISRQSIKSYELSTMLWTVRNLGKELSFTKMPQSLQPQRKAKQTKGWKLSLLTFINLLLADIYLEK